MKINRENFINQIAKNNKISKNLSEKIVKSFIDIMSDNLRKDNDILLTGFGTFVVEKRTSRKGRNPRTGDIIDIPEKKVVKFKIGKNLKKQINSIK